MSYIQYRQRIISLKDVRIIELVYGQDRADSDKDLIRIEYEDSSIFYLDVWVDEECTETGDDMLDFIWETLPGEDEVEDDED